MISLKTARILMSVCLIFALGAIVWALVCGIPAIDDGYYETAEETKEKWRARAQLLNEAKQRPHPVVSNHDDIGFEYCDDGEECTLDYAVSGKCFHVNKNNGVPCGSDKSGVCQSGRCTTK